MHCNIWWWLWTHLWGLSCRPPTVEENKGSRELFFLPCPPLLVFQFDGQVLDLHRIKIDRIQFGAEHPQSTRLMHRSDAFRLGLRLRCLILGFRALEVPLRWPISLPCCRNLLREKTNQKKFVKCYQSQLQQIEISSSRHKKANRSNASTHAEIDFSSVWGLGIDHFEVYQNHATIIGIRVQLHQLETPLSQGF